MDQIMIDEPFSDLDIPLLPSITPNPITPNSPTSTDGSPPQSPQVRKRRSRLGCLSCKKLKIKCNEGRPKCEYCIHRGRVCEYPEAKPPAPRKRKRKTSTDSNTTKSPNLIKTHSGDTIVPVLKCSNVYSKPELITEPEILSTVPTFHSSRLLQLNSMTSQMQVSPFELRLLKTFIQFGPSFFTFDIDKKAKKFWSFEVPKLWLSSPLIQKAIYSVSSVRLLGMYSKEIANDSAICQDLSLYHKSLEFQEETCKDMDKILAENTKFTGLDTDIAGQLLVAKMIMIGCKGLFPHQIDPNLSVKDSKLIKMTNFMRQSNLFLDIHVSRVLDSKYGDIVSTDESLILTTQSLSQFPFIEYLRSYVSENHETFDPISFSYNDTISMFELCANRAMILGYPVPFFRSIVKIARNDEFWHLLNQEDHTAMKLIFYLCALCSSLAFRLIPGLGVWDEFIEIYKKHCFDEFGGFDSEYDQNVYDLVKARQKLEIPYTLEILKLIGLPIEDIKSRPIKYIGKIP